MSVGHCATTDFGSPRDVAIPAAEAPPLHRIGQVRRLQGVSRRTIARRLNTNVEQVRRQEQPDCDLTISDLYAWQKALDVPIAELLTESNESLAAPILKRAQLVRFMKTVLSVRERAKQESIRRMVETMIVQLIEIMPELEGIGAWHTVGRRRRLNELGAAAQRRIADDVFID